MITAAYRAREVWAGPALLALVILVTELLGQPAREWLEYRRAAVDAGQWWRLVTCSFVHLGSGYQLGPLHWHWFVNTLALGLCVLLCPERLGVAIWLRRALLLALGMGLALHFRVPEIRQYVGLSGVVHGFFVLGLMPLALRRDWIAAAALFILIGKIGWELRYGAGLWDEAALGGRVLVESHLYGVISALLYGIVFGSFRGRERIWRRAREAQA